MKRHVVAICVLSSMIVNLPEDASALDGDVTGLSAECSGFSLWLSQWGFIGEGNSTQLSNSIGKHSVVAACAEPAWPLRFVSENWIGTMDNISVKEITGSGSNLITVTAHDEAANTGNDTVKVIYTVNGDTTPPAKPTGIDIIE